MGRRVCSLVWLGLVACGLQGCDSDSAQTGRTSDAHRGTGGAPSQAAEPGVPGGSANGGASSGGTSSGGACPSSNCGPTTGGSVSAGGSVASGGSAGAGHSGATGGASVGGTPGAGGADSGVDSGGTMDLCKDGKKDSFETDVDCGGTCNPCENGKTCMVTTDCASATCLRGVCTDPCGDGVKDGDEYAVDCASTCPCRVGSSCRGNTDCGSGTCPQSSGTCAVGPNCADGVLDGMETSVDCGGPSCAKCTVTKPCKVNADCLSNVCENHVCGPCVADRCPPSFVDVSIYPPCCTPAGVCGLTLLGATGCM